VGWSKVTAPRVLNLVTRWRSVVGFTPWSIYRWGKSQPFEVFTAVKIQVEVFWDVMSCSVTVGC